MTHLTPTNVHMPYLLHGGASLQSPRVHVPPTATHLLWYTHWFDFTQSTSDPATHLPSFAVQVPSWPHAASFWQSAFLPMMHLPPIAVQFAVFAPLQPEDCAQSASSAATQTLFATEHSPTDLQYAELEQSDPLPATHFPSPTVHNPWFVQLVLFLQSVAPMAMHSPPTAEHLPLSTHTLDAWQSLLLLAKQAPATAVHLPWVEHGALGADLQSASLPAMHAPARAVQSPDCLHIAVGRQSVSPPTTQFPPTNVHFAAVLHSAALWQSAVLPAAQMPARATQPPCEQAPDCWQSPSLPATQAPAEGVQSPNAWQHAQSGLAAATQVPPFAMQAPHFATVHIAAFWQSPSLAAIQSPATALHLPYSVHARLPAQGLSMPIVASPVTGTSTVPASPGALASATEASMLSFVSVSASGVLLAFRLTSSTPFESEATSVNSAS